jgi:Putative MetA-pathway of phenol degradation
MRLSGAPASCGLLLVSVLSVSGQELEPGAYSVSPVGVNILVLTNNFQGGDVTFDAALPIDDAQATINTTAVSYVRTLRLLGRSANLGIVALYAVGHVEGLYHGEFTEVDRSGFRDPLVRFAVNLYGGPAMDRKAFASYRQKTSVGLSLVTSLPLGAYDSGKLINLGSNRWGFKPEVGLSHAIGKWTLEVYGGVWLFTDNKNFLGNRLREQDPIGSAQVHVLRSFKPRLWASLDANYFTGGRTTVDKRVNLDLQRNSRVGATLSVPLGSRQSLKFSYSRGAYTTIGADFQAVVAAYQYLWGAGL